MAYNVDYWIMVETPQYCTQFRYQDPSYDNPQLGVTLSERTQLPHESSQSQKNCGVAL